MKLTTRNIVTMGVLCALSVVLVYFIRFPIFPAAPFLEYDAGDIPIIIGTFMFGPIPGLLMTVAVSLIQAFTVSAGSGIIGATMHILATGSLVLVAGLIYRRKKTLLSAIIALACGVVAWNISMIFWNLLFTPIFMNVPRSVVAGMLAPVIVPFNLIKSSVNAFIGIFLFKSLWNYDLSGGRIVEAREGE
ncbi:MAG: ECF transporter S component [Clostridiales bacterium]|nr:ECF transporter S component [Clostridiales bacterium]